MAVDELIFRRVFSRSMYKNLKLPLAEMSFAKDFINDPRGDLYPVITKTDGCGEYLAQNTYRIRQGAAERMFARFFPFATCEITFAGSAGFVFHLADAAAEILCDGSTVSFSDGEEAVSLPVAGTADAVTMIVSCRPGAFDVFFTEYGKPQFFTTFRSERFAESNRHSTFKNGFVCLKACGGAVIHSVSAYIDCGISQADIRPVCYEDGEPIYENGKIFFTASIRMQESSFQGIFSWVPSTCAIELTGALFFDCGDGFWRNYLASSLLYHRPTKEWYIWTSSFEHKHRLCHAAFAGEPRFGVSVIDVEMMAPAEEDDYTAFAGFRGDEDPDFYYNAEEKAWYLAICRICPEIGRFRYAFFKSDDPFTGYTYIGRGFEGSETGGGFVRSGGEMTFICGNDRPGYRSNYRIYAKDGMREARFDFCDGGFRGWGAVIPVTMGSRRRYFWLTFDRHGGSDYTWSYGNFYCFEAEM